ncbi:hypothetical protein KPH14_011052 [Odynerus spinipes]|uniref:Uncharacterized protein n=1 Tax=Odynerus spinipes TaxID=1348599 RepID=A0AAD9RHA7_9HYME|nr:hypothetical protein KPH14_011052 [Odynerus spinipes]
MQRKYRHINLWTPSVAFFQLFAGDSSRSSYFACIGLPRSESGIEPTIVATSKLRGTRRKMSRDCRTPFWITHAYRKA